MKYLAIKYDDTYICPALLKNIELQTRKTLQKKPWQICVKHT